jgi:hypothetical protein
MYCFGHTRINIVNVGIFHLQSLQGSSKKYILRKLNSISQLKML